MKISIQQAIKFLQDGKIIAAPTCTLYGLIASISITQAIQNIYKLKKRPYSKPLLILISDISQLDKLTMGVSCHLRDFLNLHWEKNTTFIFKANKKTIDPFILAGQDNVALRLSRHPYIQEIIKQIGPIVAPSVNTSNLLPLDTPQEIEALLGHDFPILDDPFPRLRKPSTIISLVNKPPIVIRNSPNKSLLEKISQLL